MTTVRSLLFVAWLYLSMAIFAVGLSPALLGPHAGAMWVIRNIVVEDTAPAGGKSP